MVGRRPLPNPPERDVSGSRRGQHQTLPSIRLRRVHIQKSGSFDHERLSKNAATGGEADTPPFGWAKSVFRDATDAQGFGSHVAPSRDGDRIHMAIFERHPRQLYGFCPLADASSSSSCTTRPANSCLHQDVCCRTPLISGVVRPPFATEAPFWRTDLRSVATSWSSLVLTPDTRTSVFGSEYPTPFL
jgi:hypothetical protein